MLVRKNRKPLKELRSFLYSSTVLEESINRSLRELSYSDVEFSNIICALFQRRISWKQVPPALKPLIVKSLAYSFFDYDSVTLETDELIFSIESKQDTLFLRETKEVSFKEKLAVPVQKTIKFIKDIAQGFFVSLFLSASLLFFSSSAPSPKISDKDVKAFTQPTFKYLKESSVVIFTLTEGGVSSGSGAVFDYDGRYSKIISAAHVFKKPISGVGVRNGSNFFPAHEIYIHPKEDLALVIVEGNVGKPLPLSEVPLTSNVACSVSSPNAEEDVIMCGFLFVKPCGSTCLGFFSPIFFGSSGGAVVDIHTRKILGIISTIGVYNYDLHKKLNLDRPYLPYGSAGATIVPVALLDSEILVKVYP